MHQATIETIRTAHEHGAELRARLEEEADSLGMTLGYYLSGARSVAARERDDAARRYSRPEWAAFEAGWSGTECPRRARGWRYGAAPVGGYSTNHRDQLREQGVSMMAVEGCDWRPDGTFAAFNGSRERVELEGWLVTHARGSDGEPLLAL